MKPLLIALLSAVPGLASAQGLAARAAAMDSAARPTPDALFEFQVERAAKLVGKPLQPRYPAALQGSQVGGTVLVRFEVDTLGAVDLATLRVLQTPHADFAAAIREAVAGARYEPARNQGRVVRQVVMQRFDFKPKH